MIEPEEYEDGICAIEAIDSAAQDFRMSEDDVWHIWKLGLEVRKQIEQQIENAPYLYEPKYENPKVVDAWVENGEIYAAVELKGWAEHLGFRVQIDVEDSHTDEPADTRPQSICPACNGSSELKKTTVKRGDPELGEEWEDHIEYYECSCGETQLDVTPCELQPLSEF